MVSTFVHLAPTPTVSETDPHVIALWETAQNDSDGGRFHDAILGFEKTKQLLEKEKESGSHRISCIVADLKARVEQELNDHLRLLEGNFFVALGLHQGCQPKQVRKAFRSFVHRFHPDKTAGVDTRALFRVGLAAHEVLSNSDLRDSYMPSILPNQWLQQRSRVLCRSLGIKNEQPKRTCEDAHHQVPVGYLWLYPSEVKTLKLSELKRVLCDIGLKNLVDGSSRLNERKELEAAYVNARRSAIVGGGRAAAYGTFYKTSKHPVQVPSATSVPKKNVSKSPSREQHLSRPPLSARDQDSRLQTEKETARTASKADCHRDAPLEAPPNCWQSSSTI
jgi:hypothetical protein